MEGFYFSGLIIAFCTFVIIGLFHPIVIKVEYYFGSRFWWVFLVVGIFFLIAAVLTQSIIISSLFGVVGASCLWSIGEILEQKERVKKGWFPMNPKRKAEYEK